MDFTFWVDYEVILLRIAVDPPPLEELAKVFEDLLESLEDPDKRAICLRNIGLIYSKLGLYEEARDAFNKARELGKSGYLKLQNTILAQARGESVKYKGVFSPTEGRSAAEGCYVAALGAKVFGLDADQLKVEDGWGLLAGSL